MMWNSRMLPLLVACLMLAGACSRSVQQAETAPTPASLDDPLPQEWTEEWRALFVGELEKAIALFPFAATEEARARFSTCFTQRIFGLFPGGPAEFERLDKEQTRTMSRGIGELCGQEFIDWLSSLETWNPAVAPAFVFGCVAEEGEGQRTYCSCVGLNSSKHFETPRDFFRAMNALAEEDESNLDDLLAAEALFESCSQDLGWSHTAINGMIDGCVEEAGAHMAPYCTCLFETAPDYYETPADLIEAIDRDEDRMSPAELAVLERLLGTCSRAAPALHPGPGALQ